MALALVGCSSRVQASAPARTTGSSVEAETPPAVPDDEFNYIDRMRQASEKLHVEIDAVKAPGHAPKQDAWPSMRKMGAGSALERDLPLYFDDGQRDGQDRAALSYVVFGATKTRSGADVYVRAVYRRSLITMGRFVMADADSSGNCVVAMVRTKNRWRIDGRIVMADEPGTGGVIDEPLPAWARARADTLAANALDARADGLAIAWAAMRLPADRLVHQPERTFPDPHQHQPGVVNLEMLNPKYAGMTITPMPGPLSDSMVDPGYDEDWHSADGRFHLRYGVDTEGMLLEDTKRGVAYDLAGPGQIPCPDGWDKPTNLPVFVGHVLVIDLWNDVTLGNSSIIHYEINCDALKVIRAVPVGSMALN